VGWSGKSKGLVEKKGGSFIKSIGEKLATEGEGRGAYNHLTVSGEDFDYPTIKRENQLRRRERGGRHLIGLYEEKRKNLGKRGEHEKKTSSPPGEGRAHCGRFTLSFSKVKKSWTKKRPSSRLSFSIPPIKRKRDGFETAIRGKKGAQSEGKKVLSS